MFAGDVFVALAAIAIVAIAPRVVHVQHVSVWLNASQTGAPEYLGRRFSLMRTVVFSSLRSNGGNLCRSARSLGVHRNTLRNKVSNLGIEVPERGRRVESPKR